MCYFFSSEAGRKLGGTKKKKILERGRKFIKLGVVHTIKMEKKGLFTA